MAAMDINALVSARIHATTMRAQLAAASLVSRENGPDEAVRTLTNAALQEQARFAQAAQSIVSSGLDIRV